MFVLYHHDEFGAESAIKFIRETRSFTLFVAASTHCFPDVSFTRSMQKLAELEFHSAEVVVGYGQSDLKPEWLEQDLAVVARMCVSQRQITPFAVFMDISADDQLYNDIFKRCVQLCQMLKTVTLVVKSSPVGSPYNEEFERLRMLTRFAFGSGIVLSLLTERESISGSVDSLLSLCNGLPELTVALDPSHFIYGYKKPVNYDLLIPKTSHVRLRDTTEKEFQVQIGQGALEFNKLVAQLSKSGYRRALCIDLSALPNSNPDSELRKMRLLVESNLF